MTSKGIDEGDVEAFLTKLKAADNDKKVDQIQFFGLRLEEASSLPEASLDALTMTFAPFLRSTSHLLVTSCLSSFLAFYIPLLPAVPQRHLQLAIGQLIPGLLEKLNDPKDRIHSAAAVCIHALGRRCYEADASGGSSGSGAHGVNGSVKGKEKETLSGAWERYLKETMAGKGTRGKLESVKILLAMRKEEGSRLPLKPWLAPLVELLEDGDGTVREQAREAIVALLAPSSTPAAARSEVKQLLAARNVRKTIADPILSRIFGGRSSAAKEPDVPASETSEGNPSGSGAATPAPGDEIPVIYVASARDLESEFSKMLPHFEGKETEHNWTPREKAVVRMRGMLRGKVVEQYREAFLAGLRSGILEGLNRTVVSLRTTVSQQSCALLQELAEHLGSSFDPFVDNVMAVLAKMAGYTKKIIADKSQKVVTAIIIHTTCHPRLYISHILSGIGDKNIQTRHFCTSHLKTFLDAQAQGGKASIDAIPGLLHSLESGVSKSLADVNPGVRELARLCFWAFSATWPARAKVIQESLDPSARKQLDKANPREGNTPAIPARPAVAKRATTSTAALLAERRKAAKAAETAAADLQASSPRIVSNPVMPSATKPVPRSTSSSSLTPKKTTLTRSTTSPAQSSKASSPQVPTMARVPSPRDALARSRSSSLARTLSQSPPAEKSTPLRPTGTIGMRSTTSSSAATMSTLKTPVMHRKPLPTFANGSPVASRTARPAAALGVPQITAVIDDAMRAQADQAISAAEQLLDFEEPPPAGPSSSIPPVTPARPATAANGYGFGMSTPANGSGRAVWEDSPRNQAVTPQFLDRLKGRKQERSWWARQKQLLEASSPLRQASDAPPILIDLNALSDGSPSLRNLQRLALFSAEHHVPLLSEAGVDEDDVADAKHIWLEGRLFDDMFRALTGFLDAARPADLLEQALVLLWEMIQHQWELFEDKEDTLLDSLFRLRASSSHTILESTNSLLSLLTSTSDPIILLAVLRSSLTSFLSSIPAPSRGTIDSATLFALTGMGRCILSLPAPAVEIEAARLATILTTALAREEVTTRQAGVLLIVAVQAVLGDSTRTLALFPGLTKQQRDLATYYMATNGLMRAGTAQGPGVAGHEQAGRVGQEDRDKVLGEMDGLMIRGMS